GVQRPEQEGVAAEKARCDRIQRLCGGETVRADPGIGGRQTSRIRRNFLLSRRNKPCLRSKIDELCGQNSPTTAGCSRGRIFGTGNGGLRTRNASGRRSYSRGHSISKTGTRRNEGSGTRRRNG